MKIKNQTLVLKVVAFIAVVILFFLILFDRYTYDDYHVGVCDNKRFGLVANLVGSFGSDHPRERSSPYYLRIEIVGENKERLTIREVGLISVASRKKVDLRKGERVEVKDPRGSVLSVVYLADSLFLEYDDYFLYGVAVVRSASKDESFAFSCRFDRNEWGEWRVPLWDALMSI
ncbi:hypothetical protein QE400_003219 [Xanthomonas sacchari]|uniref:hypothetical protein n=1 Tax=Xanthomonas sacchari TaxID=56458 RepID=UPI00277E59A1|nr:hypothetical protein [Xanthomonas sacchari]MDQ1093806.1 hypothetical protein [Xanthomonas sacchari]